MGLLLVIITLLFSTPPVEDGGEMRTRNTVRLSLAWYALALCLMIRLRTADWRAQSLRGRITRWCWTWANICFFVHLATAFTYYHHWSHAQAVEHTRLESGVGEGVFALYAFVGLGVIDATWWWVWPSGYARRSTWIDRGLHAYMLFIVFNAMIVFESGLSRWMGVLLFLVLPVAWYWERGLPRLQLSL